MRKKLSNERGLTLIEVLAATVIGTMLILLIGNALLFGLKQYKNQSIKAQELTDVTFVAKVITKDIRKATEVTINEGGSILSLRIEDDEVIYKFNEEDKIILKNNEIFFTGIGTFKVMLDEERSHLPDEENRLLNLEIESQNKNGIEEKIDTKIYLRKGVEFD